MLTLLHLLMFSCAHTFSTPSISHLSCPHTGFPHVLSLFLACPCARSLSLTPSASFSLPWTCSFSHAGSFSQSQLFSSLLPSSHHCSLSHVPPCTSFMPLPYLTTMHPFLPPYSHCHTLTLLHVLSLFPTTSLCFTLFSRSLLFLCQSLCPIFPFPFLFFLSCSLAHPFSQTFLVTLRTFLQPCALSYNLMPFSCNLMFSLSHNHMFAFTHTFSLTIFLSQYLVISCAFMLCSLFTPFPFLHAYAPLSLVLPFLHMLTHSRVPFLTHSPSLMLLISHMLVLSTAFSLSLLLTVFLPSSTPLTASSLPSFT